VLLGGPEDASMAEKLTAMDPVKIYNACGKFRLMESADIVRRSRLVITHDTGMMHMAAAFKKPIVSIWGNTIPAFGMFPYYGQNNIYQHPSPLSIMHEVKGLSCRPCSKIGFKSCPKKHFRCMQDQNIDAIVRDVNALLQKK
jgi:ADP-heptose:LPS heptosyltransferase